MNGSDALEAWERGDYDTPECEECIYYYDWNKCAECLERGSK